MKLLNDLEAKQMQLDGTAELLELEAEQARRRLVYNKQLDQADNLALEVVKLEAQAKAARVQCRDNAKRLEDLKTYLASSKYKADQKQAADILKANEQREREIQHKAAELLHLIGRHFEAAREYDSLAKRLGESDSMTIAGGKVHRWISLLESDIAQWFQTGQVMAEASPTIKKVLIKRG